MCGRFTLRTDPASWAQQFLPGLVDLFHFESPRYNIAPTQQIASILYEEDAPTPCIKPLRWGLVPNWANDIQISAGMINARSETVAEKPAFRRAFRKRRCLIPADGYFEWTQTQDGKQPYLFTFSSEPLFAFAGLWETNRRCGGTGHVIESCTILTTAAQGRVTEYHDRMPVILGATHWQQWLDPQFQDVEALKALLNPEVPEDLTIHPVSRFVNRAQNQGPECVQVVE